MPDYYTPRYPLRGAFLEVQMVMHLCFNHSNTKALTSENYIAYCYTAIVQGLVMIIAVNMPEFKQYRFLVVSSCGPHA